MGGANDQQKIAIATGAAQAMKQLVSNDPAAAAEGQEKILAVPDETFKTAAINAFGDVKLGALGGAPGQGPLGGPAGAPGGVGALQDIRSTPINTPNFTFGAGTTGLGFVGGSTTTTTTTEWWWWRSVNPTVSETQIASNKRGSITSDGSPNGCPYSNR